MYIYIIIYSSVPFQTDVVLKPDCTSVNELGSKHSRVATGTIGAFSTQIFSEPADEIILGVTPQRTMALPHCSSNVSVNRGRLFGLFQGQDHGIRSRDYDSSVMETTALLVSEII